MLPLEPGDTLMRGQLVAAPKLESAAGCKTKVSNTLFTDDGASTFKSCDEMRKLLPAVKEVFAKLGLLMHVRAVDNSGELAQLRTKAMHHPAQLSTLTLEQLAPEPMHFVKEAVFKCTAPLNWSTLEATSHLLCLMNVTSRSTFSKQQPKLTNSRTSGDPPMICK